MTLHSNNMVVEHDAILLSIIALKAKSPVESNSAFNAFYIKYSTDLYNYIEVHCKKHKNWKQISKEVFCATIDKVYRYCGSFNTEGVSDPIIIEKKIKGWLGRIAKNEYLSLLANNKQEREDQSAYLAEVKIARGVTSGNPVKTSAAAKILNESLRQLTERDREILLASYEFRADGKKLTTQMTANICQRFGVTEISRRQIVSRSKRKVIEYIVSKGFTINQLSDEPA